MRPFRIDIPQPEIDDLRHRLDTTRWPDAGPVGDWSHGLPLDLMRDLTREWAHGHDWRTTQDRLNRIPQFTHEGIHFLHVRSARADATPLVLTHGWPGSFLEFDP